jgi:flagellar basal-body rod protein FlgF
MDGIAWAASAMSAARARLEIATQNLANGSSDGFRRIRARGFLDGSGVRIARETDAAQGALRRTGRPFDLALVGAGAFRVRGAMGTVAVTRNGAFTRAANGTLRDDAGRTLLGIRGPLHVAAGARILETGAVVAGNTTVDRIGMPTGTTLRTGYVEASNVDAISEMLAVLSAQRSFEGAEKAVAAIDQARQKSADEVARLK